MDIVIRTLECISDFGSNMGASMEQGSLIRLVCRSIYVPRHVAIQHTSSAVLLPLRGPFRFCLKCVLPGASFLRFAVFTGSSQREGDTGTDGGAGESRFASGHMKERSVPATKTGLRQQKWRETLAGAFATIRIANDFFYCHQPARERV